MARWSRSLSAPLRSRRATPTHPEPDRALSDAAAQLPLERVPALLRTAKAIHEAVKR